MIVGLLTVPAKTRYRNNLPLSKSFWSGIAMVLKFVLPLITLDRERPSLIRNPRKISRFKILPNIACLPPSNQGCCALETSFSRRSNFELPRIQTRLTLQGHDASTYSHWWQRAASPHATALGPHAPDIPRH